MQSTIRTRVLGAVGFVVLAGALAIACGDDDAGLSSSGGLSQPDASVSSSSSGGASSSSGGTSSSSSGSSGTPIPDAGSDLDAGLCSTQLALPLDPNAQATATTDLATISATATLTWADTYNALQSTQGLSLPQAACTGDKKVSDVLFPFLAAHPDLFQIDPAEWTAADTTCASVTEFQNFTIHRVKYGPYAIAQDTFTVVLNFLDGAVTFGNFSGFYVPKPSSAILTELAACADKPAEQLAGLLEKDASFHYGVYEASPAPPCTLENGTFEYSFSNGDTLTLDPAISVTYADNGTTQVFHRQQGATLVVAQANYSADLIASDANCFDEDGNPNIGWTLTFDPGSGELYDQHLTPDLGCNVCLK